MTFTHAETFTTRPTLQGHFGMTASTHWLATASSQAVLERGGNAFDAAVAGAFVLHVVEPHLNGPGGDMVGIFATADAGSTPQVLMGQGPAPSGALIEHYRALGLESVPGAGALAAAIPAAVDAWLVLLRDHGTFSLAEVLDYAIGYAQDGHPILPGAVRAIRAVAELFQEHWPTSAALWMPEGKVPEPGQIIRNPEYAQVLRELIAAGDGVEGRIAQIEAARTEWKTGRVARSAAEFVKTPHRHSDGGDYAGVITAEDFASHSAGYEHPTSIEFRGQRIAKSGPWGQGPALLQALKILEGYPDEQLDPGTETGAHLILEAQKLALADRDTYYGDVPVNLEHLLSEDYAAQRRAQIGERASAEFRPGDLPGTEKVLPALVDVSEAATGAGAGEPTVSKAGETKGDTCHIDVVDRWGNIVSATPSGGWLQSSPVIEGLGFCLGTRLQMTWLDERSASRLQPGKRPRTTLTPTLVLKDGAPWMALGTPGGDQQDQWQLPMLLRMLIGGHTAQQAIDAPTLHTTSMPGSFWPRAWEPGGAVVEDRLGAEVIEGLRRRGHKLTLAGDWALGRLSCVTRDPQTGQLGAAANARGAQGYAAGR
ncbi:gamma-glutamyltransferase family protein [Nesterenkonia jeotgali]|uniref:Gamma-glutamyltranspeptidase/glutathione hydrolase n=1 Tax=Nesterenkonia jeotgali TaxID=317018 RepID=A0A0W8ICL9_9MICC|nr:gamma-glutamyltransferase [Nesterenkonia jeotgali]KUG57697.1 transferase [Nesterenkonia jeotgali]MBA8920407.1 gamma-glutamyltranspeptidase/glutathione hydrolase [Nesterenkonia jeotgali]